ncbi:MAG: class I SAM-dependent methyltransferase [Defluviitaleaceae bacterium]|nr:class I SAM-dependent methyltransferase [Defluviitaleaceae bacterium]
MVQRLSNNDPIDFDKMTVAELYKLHYEEETFVAKAVRELPAFSAERSALLSDGYRFITELMDCRHAKEFGTSPQILGANHGTARALIRIIDKKRGECSGQPVALCEIGVGQGFALKRILENYSKEEVAVSGCDVFLSHAASRLAEEYPYINLVCANAYDYIRTLPENSIDVLYADNVFEHFLPDEAPVIYEALVKKLKPGAFVFLIIPNRFTGPGDISKFFLPMGAKAAGFHFMEMGFKEATFMLKAYGLYHAYHVSYLPKVQKYIMVKSKPLIRLKLKMESLLAKIPFKRLKSLLFYIGGYSIYLMRKQ